MRDLDEFQIVRPLGRGGMGEVFLGHDTILDRAVAIKLIGTRTPDLASRDRFLREARAIARLSHPNVVTIFRVGTTADGRPFLVQELIRGTSLDRLARPVPPARLATLALGIARGLAAAHRRAILHRDIKPANVMLDDHGTPRLLDFGLAKLSQPDEPAASLWPRATSGACDGHASLVVAVTADRPRALAAGASTAPRGIAAHETATGTPAPTGAPTGSGAVLGTPRYAAPERWRGEPATARSDLYSLGVLLYELATGVAPFPQTEVAELERAVLAGAPRPVAELAALPPALARLVMRCLALDPAARPASAADLAHELELLVAGAPAIPDGNPYRGLRAFRAEHRALFFGRGGDVAELVDRFQSEALLVVAGDSGIGKSSLCHAGVVPAVIAGALADHRRWRAITLAPGRRPWDRLCEALGVTCDPVELLRRARPVDGDGILLVIDPLEELVTVAEPAQAARVAAMLAALADGTPGIKALLAVRGDFLTRVAAIAELERAITRGLHLLRVLSPSDLRDAIMGPARAHGVAFESPALVDTLIATVAAEPGALPLLQFALAALWQRRDVARALIPEAALAALGVVAGALARHADQVVLELAAPARAAARSVLLRLVTPAHTRAIRSRDELAADAVVLESLVAGRLVVARDSVDGVATYELAHEALITSWGTLRDWLAAAAGQHAIRSRLLGSATEWQRLDRRADLLWNDRQLAELVERRGLAAHEHAFVAAAQRRARWRRAARVAALLAVPLLALAIWVGVERTAQRARARDVAARAGIALWARHVGDALAHVAGALRGAAFAVFDRHNDERGERIWADARALGTRARDAYATAESALEAARMIDDRAVRDPLIGVLIAEAELARAERDRVRFTELERQLAIYQPDGARPWQQPAHLVVTCPGASRITLHAADPRGALAGGYDATPRASAAALDVTVPPGSYLVLVEWPVQPPVRDPVLLAPGQRLTRALQPPVGPAGFAYVAPGTFLYGSDRDDEFRQGFLAAQPMHPVATRGYLIARTEVTFGDWLAFLADLPAAERARRRPQDPTVRLDGVAGQPVLTLHPTTTDYRSAGELLTYPGRHENATVHWRRLPVSGVSWDDARAYFAWLDRTGRVPHARPCTTYEWERATRGADGRTFPTGDTLSPDAANIDATYGRDPLGFGPDEVGAHPASDSPYGVSDTAGNAWDLVAGPHGETVMKGGAWYYQAMTSNAANTGDGEASQRNIRLGYRVCADAGSAR